MFLYRGIQYNIFGLIPKTSYVTQTLNIKYRGTIERRATPVSTTNKTEILLKVALNTINQPKPNIDG